MTVAPAMSAAIAHDRARDAVCDGSGRRAPKAWLRGQQERGDAQRQRIASTTVAEPAPASWYANSARPIVVAPPLGSRRERSGVPPTVSACVRGDPRAERAKRGPIDLPPVDVVAQDGGRIAERDEDARRNPIREHPVDVCRDDARDPRLRRAGLVQHRSLRTPIVGERREVERSREVIFGRKVMEEAAVADLRLATDWRGRRSALRCENPHVEYCSRVKL